MCSKHMEIYWLYLSGNFLLKQQCVIATHLIEGPKSKDMLTLFSAQDLGQQQCFLLVESMKKFSALIASFYGFLQDHT